jgi:hypothetical protein
MEMEAPGSGSEQGWTEFSFIALKIGQRRENYSLPN